MDIEEKLAALDKVVAVLAVQTEANKEAIVTVTEDIKTDVQGMRTQFGTMDVNLREMRAQMAADKASEQTLVKAKRTVWAAVVAIAGLVGFIVNLYMHKGGGE